jgi:hypothetical protein
MEVFMSEERRYVQRFALWMGLFVLMFLPMIVLFEVVGRHPIWGSLRWTFAALPFIPLLLALGEFRHGLASLDELQRHIQLEAFAFSLACTSMLAFAYGLLEAFGEEPHVSLIFVLPAAALFWFVGAALARRRYQ